LVVALALVGCVPAKQADVARVKRGDIAAARLPRDTALWVVTPNLAALADTLDKRTVERGLRARYEALSYELVQETGHNLFDLGELSAIGVDVRAPAGVAWLLAPERALVGFVTLRDPGRFKSELYRLASGVATGARPVRPEVVENAVIAADGKIGVLVEDELAMLIVADDAWTVANRLARLDPRETLATDSAFRKARAQTSPRAALYGYADVRAWIYDQAGLDPRWRGSTLAAAVQDVERAHRSALRGARERNAEPSELVMIDELFQRERAALRDDDKARRLRASFGSIDGVSLSAELQPNSLELEASLAVDERTFLALTKADVPMHTELGRLAGGHIELELGERWLRSITRDSAPQEPPPAEVRGTAEYREKRERLAALDAEIAKLAKRRHAAKQARARDLARALGQTRVTLESTHEGVVLHLTHVTRGPSFAQLFVDLHRLDEEAQDEDGLPNLLEKRRALDDELYELEKSGADRR